MKPVVLFVHSNAELYGADFILLQTVVGLRDLIAPIVAVPSEGPLTERLRQAGIEVVLTRESILRRINLSARRLPGFGLAVIRDSLALRALIKRRGVALVYSNTAAVVTGAIAARLSGVRHLYHIHEIILTPPWFARKIARHVLTTADAVVAVSDAVKRQLERFRAAGDAPVHVIYNGIEPALQNSPQEREAIRAECGATAHDVLIGVVGRIHPWKGQDYFVDAAALVAAACPNARFVIIGGTFAGYEGLVDDLRERVRSRKLEQVLRILPHRSDIADVMRALDIFVLPSTLPDPLPTVVLEAMSAGTAVVATAHGGALEMILDGATGFTAPYDDAALFADPIIMLARDRSLRSKLGEAGLMRQRTHFARGRFLSEIGEMMTSLASSPKRR